MTRLHRVLVPLLLLLAIYALAWLFVEDLPLIGQAHPQQYLLLVSNASDDSHKHVCPLTALACMATNRFRSWP